MPYSPRQSFAIVTLLLGLSGLTGADRIQDGSPTDHRARDTSTRVMDLKALTDMERLIERLTAKRVIFVGESHDRYEDHLNQLAIIKGLHAKGRRLAIGMEFFQQPFQAHLDAYVAGEIPERELLRRTEYFERWRFDYRLYRPILRFARGQAIPLLALNLEREITQQVGDGGIDSLSATEQARLPAMIDRGDADYRKRIEAVFAQHPMAEDKNFEHFLEVQLLWDESMAERAARYLREHPDRTLILLAGAGHLEYGQGIPRRLLRRIPVTSAILLNGAEREPAPELADFLLYPRPVPLPAPGRLGVLLDTDAPGPGIAVQGFTATSGAQTAGMRQGDRILKVGEETIDAYSDIRIALLDRRPGDRLPVEVLRQGSLSADQRLTFAVTLH